MTDVKVDQLGNYLMYESALLQHVINLVPRTRGNWLIGSALVKGIPRRYRSSILSLRSTVGAERIDISLDLSDPAQFAMVKNNRFDLLTASLIWSLLKEGDTFIDVGANWGYFTNIGSQAVGASGTVLAFEPNAKAFQRLLDTLRRNVVTNVFALNNAAYETAGKTMSLFSRFYRQTTGSFVRAAAREHYWDTVTTTLDYSVSKVRNPVRLVKVDTEGAELLVMKGAEELLHGWKPWVILEVSSYSRRFGYHMNDLYDYMASLGYTRTYTINDSPESMELSGPLQDKVEGQILFVHTQTDLPAV
jgi:FkbM family methyltransferase